MLNAYSACLPYWEVVKGDVNNLPVYIEADKAEINQPTQAIYQGNGFETRKPPFGRNSVEVKQTGEEQPNSTMGLFCGGGFDYKIIKLIY